MVIIRWNWLITNKTNQATKYDGEIGCQQTRQTKQSNMTVKLVDNKQDKPNSLVDDKRVWFVLMGHQESLVDNKRVCLPWWNNFFVSLMLGTTEPDEKDIWIGWCGRCFKTQMFDFAAESCFDRVTYRRLFEETWHTCIIGTEYTESFVIAWLQQRQQYRSYLVANPHRWQMFVGYKKIKKPLNPRTLVTD